MNFQIKFLVFIERHTKRRFSVCKTNPGIRKVLHKNKYETSSIQIKRGCYYQLRSSTYNVVKDHQK